VLGVGRSRVHVLTFDQVGVIAAASQVPRWPATTSNSTAVCTAMVREPSAMRVQWNPYRSPSAVSISPSPRR
jgi:hypothetical protein